MVISKNVKLNRPQRAKHSSLQLYNQDGTVMNSKRVLTHWFYQAKEVLRQEASASHEDVLEQLLHVLELHTVLFQRSVYSQSQLL